MTSEVLILNKRAVILAADSAVTTSGGEHPRYSKSANKIFELSHSGSVAAAIYGNAVLDSVPWELALKLFRVQLGTRTFGRLDEYQAALVSFLSGNENLFPNNVRVSLIEGQFDNAVKEVLREAKKNDPSIFDEGLPLVDRQDRWIVESTRIRNILAGLGISSPLSQGPLDELLADLEPWARRAQTQLDIVPALAGVTAQELAELGHRVRYTRPDILLGITGLVVAGYGDDQIFPAYEQLDVYGHIGDQLYYTKSRKFEVTHTDIAMIQPLAQTSMIDMFTDGFGSSLEQIISQQGDKAFTNLFNALAAKGIVVPQEIAESVSKQIHTDFMLSWKRENWRQNYNPLVNVLQNLSVQEMAHLAESLLGLESLKERVTSPTESVGGPIDVAAITKSEGLVWIKRKHYFDATLNMRYAARLRQTFD